MALAVGSPPILVAAVAATLGASAWLVVAGAALGAALAAVAVVRLVMRPMAADAVDARLALGDAEERNRALRSTVELRDRFDGAAAAEDSEAGVLRLLVRAATELVPDRDVALLL